MFTNLFCHSASTVRENSAGFFVIANYYSLNKYTYGTNYFKSKLLLTIIMLLSLWLIAAIVSINALWRRTNKLRDYCDVLYSRINLLDKYQKENHDLMIKIVATAQDVNENNAEIIKHNKSLIEALEQKSE